jgi:hypothetical protein
MTAAGVLILLINASVASGSPFPLRTSPLALRASHLAPRASHLVPRPSPQDVIDRIMAVVDGTTITLSDVNAVILFRLMEPPAGTADPVGHTLNRLIERTLILAEVERFQPPEPDPIEITIRLDEIEKRSGAAAFEKALSVTGSTSDQLRRYLRNDLRITTYLNQRFGANTDPAERAAAVAAWVAELRRRADITVQYKGPGK